MDLSTQRVLITGAATGIGAATARALAARGARVGLVGLEPERLARLAAELGGSGHAWAEADVTDSAGLQAAVDSVAGALGGLDTVIANAGIASFGTVRGYDPEAFARTVEVNLTGAFRTAHATLPRLIESRGYLLVVSSLAATVPAMGFSAYGASKAGVEALADALRIEAAPLGVTVGCAHMCWIDTEMVREAERDLSTFRAMREQLVWPLNTVRPVSECSAAFVQAVQRRSRRIHVPRVVGLFHWIRPLVHTGLVDSLLARRTAGQLAALDEEIRALGRSVSERVRRSQPLTTPRRS